MTGLSAGGLSGLIGAIYDRAIDPGLWPETLGRIRLALGAENAALSLIDLRLNEFLLNFTENLPDAWAGRIQNWSGEIIAAWGGQDFLLSHPLQEPVIWSRVVPARQARENSYTRAMISGGMADALSLGLTRDRTVIGSCVFGRARKAGPFSEAEVDLARLLAPHLQRAITFSRLLELATLRGDGFKAALDAVAVPTMLVTAKAELVHANVAGHVLLARREVLMQSEGRVGPADLRYQRLLSEALVAADRKPNGPPEKLDIELGSAGQRVRLLPLTPGSVRGALYPAATAAIVLTTAPKPRKPDRTTIVSHLIERHRLTKSEAAVAIEIARGDGRAAAATRLGIRENTVRTHLSAIFQKLQINRQAQLVQLVNEADGSSAR